MSHLLELLMTRDSVAQKTAKGNSSRLVITHMSLASDTDASDATGSRIYRAFSHEARLRGLYVLSTKVDIVAQDLTSGNKIQTGTTYDFSGIDIEEAGEGIGVLIYFFAGGKDSGQPPCTCQYSEDRCIKGGKSPGSRSRHFLEGCAPNSVQPEQDTLDQYSP